MNAAGFVCSFLASAFWQSTLLVLATWIVLRAFRGANATTRYAIWLAVLIASLALPLVTTIASEPRAPATARAFVTQPISANVGAARLSNAASSPMMAPAPNSHGRYVVPAFAGTVIAWIWAAIAGVLVLRLASSLLHIEGLKRDALPLAPERRSRLSSWNRANRGVRDVRLCVSDRASVPTAIGLFDAMVLIPADLERGLDAADLDRIVMHELAHLRRHDDWSNAFAQLAGALLFFSPAVTFAVAQLDLEREVACDDSVVAAETEALTYANTLARMTEIVAWPHRRIAAPGIFMTRRGMSMRIERILEDGRDVRSRVTAGPAVFAVAAIAAIALAGTFAPSIALSQTEHAGMNLTPIEDSSPSALSYSGTWELKYETGRTPHNNGSHMFHMGGGKGLQLSLHYPAALSDWDAPADLAALGIDPARLRGANAPIAFNVKRDAGTFECTGEAGNGTGSGKFVFLPNVGYASAFAALGMKLTPGNQIVAAMADIPPSYARGIADLGMFPMSFQDFIGLSMFGGSLEEVQMLHRDFPSADARAMTATIMMMRKNLADVHPLHELFPNATIEDVTAMGMAGVTPEFVDALRDAGVRGLSASSVTALKTLGVDIAFVKRMVDAGKTGLTADDVAALKTGGF